jgi:acetolactate synthase small subunit
MTLSQAIRGEEKRLYQVMFLKNDRHQNVEQVEKIDFEIVDVEQVEKIDLEELGKHLQLGESVFITSRLSSARSVGTKDDL